MKDGDRTHEPSDDPQEGAEPEADEDLSGDAEAHESSADEVDGADEWDGWDGTVAGEETGWVDPPGEPQWGALAGTFVMGVVTCLVAVLLWGVLDRDDREPDQAGAGLVRQSQPEESDTADTPTSAPTAAPTDTRLSRCTAAAERLEQALDTARPALDQWSVHVGAMNQLVVGEITLQQATQFWNRTRVAARRHVDSFRAAMDGVRRDGVDCPAPGLLAPGARELPDCAREVVADVRVVRAATTSIDTWDEHINHMDMLRMGQLSPDDATRMWLSMWQQGVRDLDAYRLAVREARRLAGCTKDSTGG